MACARVGDLLVEADLINERQLNQALEYQQSRGGKTLGILVELGALAHDDVYHFLATRGIPALNPIHCMVQDHVAQLLPRDFVLKHEMIPVDRLGRLLTVVMVYPFDIDGIQEAEAKTGLTIKPVLCRAKEFREAFHRIYPSDLEVIGLNDVGTSSVRSLCNRAGRTNAQLAKHTITRIRELVTLPVSRHTKGRFAMLKGVGGMNFERAAAVLSRDPVALAKILAEANAREWTRRTPVVDRHDAIAALGMRRVIDTLSALTTCDEQLRYVETCFTQWRENAVSVAETALNIAKNYANVAAPGVYEAALLHNIGSLVFLMLETAEYPSVFDTHPTKLRRDRESELFGIDAAEAGAELADAWGLPTSVINTIRYLHTPESAPNAHDTVAVTALAHNIVQMERSLEADCTEALRILGLTPTALRNTVLRIHANTHADAVEI